ncbi:MAG: ABC-F family ATP-binding cassette domain-containing protein [Bacteroidota bacterium]
MVILQNLSYLHPDKEPLFDNLNLVINQYDKIALIGNNGTGKSTLLKIIAGELKASGGQLHVSVEPYYVPQIFGQYNHLSIAQALRVDIKLRALQEILDGNPSEANLDLLQDDWSVEERCIEALNHWQLTGLDLAQKMESLSGGQKTKVFLAGILIHQPALVLMDEPSNHLDTAGRTLLYDFVQSAPVTQIVVSHDRKLLGLLNTICELSKGGITVYGGNYDFYTAQKQIENEALNQDLKSKEKALRKAREKERESLERQQKLDARGKKKQEKAGVATIMMNTLRNNAEKSTSQIKHVHAEKISGISQELQALRTELPGMDKMKSSFDHSALHKGKILCKATGINFAWGNKRLWNNDLDFQITSGERIALKGLNGSGKTTLIKIILGTLSPPNGTIYRADNEAVYIDQDYTLINNGLKLYEQAERFNNTALQEHEIKTRLHRFLFTKEDWGKSCSALSGGERLRLILCCLSIASQAPDMILLDEPTNNLDLVNIEILTAAINEYQGTLLVVSHDEAFLEQVNIKKIIQL